jgi:hypothetical protein
MSPLKVFCSLGRRKYLSGGWVGREQAADRQP